MSLEIVEPVKKNSYYHFFFSQYKKILTFLVNRKCYHTILLRSLELYPYTKCSHKILVTYSHNKYIKIKITCYINKHTYTNSRIVIRKSKRNNWEGYIIE